MIFVLIEHKVLLPTLRDSIFSISVIYYGKAETKGSAYGISHVELSKDGMVVVMAELNNVAMHEDWTLR